MIQLKDSLTWGDSRLTVTLHKEGRVSWASPNKFGYTRTREECQWAGSSKSCKGNVPSHDRMQQLNYGDKILVKQLSEEQLKVANEKVIIKNHQLISGVEFSKSTCLELGFKSQPQVPVDRLIAYCHEIVMDKTISKPWLISWILQEINTGRQIHVSWNTDKFCYKFN